MERAHDYYINANRSFSDIQEERPAAMKELEEYESN